MIAREPIPDLPATHAEIRADLAEASRLARQRAGRRPDPAVAELAAKVEALAWHHRPAWDGADLPVIAFLHGCNQAARQIARANAAVREAATVRLPERPAPRQKALFG